jgi:hypothetical protein
VIDYVIALLVLALMLLGFVIVVRVAKRRGGAILGGKLWGGSGGLRLRVLEGAQLDGKRRLVLVSCDGREYLLLLGIHGDIVVDSLRGSGGSFSDEMLHYKEDGSGEGDEVRNMKTRDSRDED